MKWETVVNIEGDSDLTERLRVPGGWLYRVMLWTEPVQMTIVFVPYHDPRKVVENDNT